MLCPNCQKSETAVVDSRDDNKTVWRRRKCLSCDARFTTYERMEVPRLIVIKRDGRREQFNKEKIVTGIRKACEKRPIPTLAITQIADSIEAKIYETGESEIPSKKLGKMVMDELLNLDSVAYIRFASVYRHFKTIKSFDKELKKIMNK